MKKLRRLVLWLLGTVLRPFRRKPVILFESTPDFSDNTYAVYLEFVRRGLDQKYMMVWDCAGDHAPEGIQCVFPEKGLREKLKKLYYMAGSKAMICCNRFLLPMTGRQTSFYLTHGTPLKSVKGYYKIPPQINYCLSAGEAARQVTADQLNMPPEKMFTLGFPRNDIFALPPEPVKQMLNTQCKKVLVWYPTFRQHTNGRKAGSGKALPIIHNEQAAAELNQFAREQDVLLVLKPHFAQDVSGIRDMQLSNICFIDDSFFEKHNTTSYGFVGGCDGLITDYSSIYFDYLLCDKPIGLVWEDVEDYKKNPGFAMDPEACCAGGRKIYDLQDFKDFIQEISEGKDPCGDVRRTLRDQFNFSTDGQNAARVADFIIQKAGL